MHKNLADLYRQVGEIFTRGRRWQLRWCAVGWHRYLWSEKLQIARRKPDWSADPPWLFQIGKCSGCGRMKRHYVGEARVTTDKNGRLMYTSELVE